MSAVTSPLPNQARTPAAPARPSPSGLGGLLRRAYAWHRPLMLMVASMALLVLVSAGGMLFDGREQMGVSVWEKSLKFGTAFVFYGTTLAWMASLTTKAKRTVWAMGLLVAVSGFADVAMVAMQSARGTFSHFNMTDDFYAGLNRFVFNTGVPALLLFNLVLAVILMVQRVGDKATALAIRLSAAFSVVGMGMGVLMSVKGSEGGTYTDGNGHAVDLVIGHTVGGRDDGALIPFVHWSATGGDLRIPHFVGMHGMQVILLVALLVNVLAARAAWLCDERTRRSVIAVAAAGYAGLTALVAWQALRGQSLIHPDARTWAALGVIAVVTAAGLASVYAVGRSRARLAAARTADGVRAHTAA